MPRLYGGARSGYYKDAFHEHLVGQRADAIRSDQRGTKCALHYALSIPGEGQQSIVLRLSEASSTVLFVARRRYDVRAPKRRG